MSGLNGTGIVSPDDPHLPAPQQTVFDATPDCIKVLSLDGRVLMMNKAGCLALHIPLDSGFGMPWLPLLSEDIRQLGHEALQKAGRGETARFPGKSGSPENPTFWDNLLLPLVDSNKCVLSVMCVSRDVTEKKTIELKLEEALEREKLLSHEMHHRVKNAFSIVAGLISVSEKEARLPDASETATTILREKILSLGRASDVVFAYGQIAEAGTDLEALAKSILEPYGDHCELAGEPTKVGRDATTALALLFHELATNSVKYGALSANSGTINLRWKADRDTLLLTWTEAGGPSIAANPDRSGFGSIMVDRILQSLRGSINRKWHSQGLVVEISVPRTPLAV